jgi:hypothetical protein
VDDRAAALARVAAHYRAGWPGRAQWREAQRNAPPIMDAKSMLEISWDLTCTPRTPDAAPTTTTVSYCGDIYRTPHGTALACTRHAGVTAKFLKCAEDTTTTRNAHTQRPHAREHMCVLMPQRHSLERGGATAQASQQRVARARPTPCMGGADTPRHTQRTPRRAPRSCGMCTRWQ